MVGGRGRKNPRGLGGDCERRREDEQSLVMQEIERAIQQLSEQVEEVKELVLDLTKKLDDTEQDKWIDGQDVLLALRISPRTLRTLRKSEKLPYSRINNKLYYRESDIKQLLQSNYIRYHLSHTP